MDACIVAGNTFGPATTTVPFDVFGAVTRGSNTLIGSGNNLTRISSGTNGNLIGTEDNPNDPVARLARWQSRAGRRPSRIDFEAGAYVPDGPADDAGTDVHFRNLGDRRIATTARRSFTSPSRRW